MLLSKPPDTPEELFEEYQKFLKQYQDAHLIKSKIDGKKNSNNELQISKPKTSQEAFELVTKYHAELYFFKESIPQFLVKYGSWYDEAIKAEIDRLELFIKKAEKIPYFIAVDSNTLKDNDIKKYKQYIFLRFKNGYYENLSLDSYPEDYSLFAEVYGTYFSYYNYLKKVLNDWQKHTETIIEEKSNDDNIKNSVSLSENFLYIFQGKNLRNHRKILDDNDYKRLVDYSNFMLKNDIGPTSITPMRINVSQAVVGYTYKLLFQANFNSQYIPPYLITFLHTVFIGFNEKKKYREAEYTKSSIYKKLAKPKGYDELVLKCATYKPQYPQ